MYVSTGMVGHVCATAEARQGVSAPHTTQPARPLGAVGGFRKSGNTPVEQQHALSNIPPKQTLISEGQESGPLQSTSSASHANRQVCSSANILDTPKSPSSDAFFSSPYVKVFRRCHRNQPQAQEVAAWRSCKEHICFVR